MKRYVQGYTLIELLIAVSIIACLVCLSVPAWHSLVAINQQATVINRLVAAIYFARSEAIKRNAIVTLCATTNRRQCSDQWTDGQLVFIDRNGQGMVATKQDILKVYMPLPKGSLLRWQAFGSNHYLQLTPTGFTHAQNGTFIYCPPSHNSQAARAIFVSKTGRLRLSTDADQDGIEEDAEGHPLHCA